MKTSHREIIIDTGFFIALLNKNDQYHKIAIKLMNVIPNRQWVSTWPVLTEVCYMLNRDKLYNSVQGVLDLYERGGLKLFQMDTHHMLRMKSLMKKYQNLPIDFADASLILLAEALGHGEILSTDLRDFETYRFKNHQPFTNLFLAK